MIHVRQKYTTDCMVAGIACYTETPIEDIFKWMEETFGQSAEALLANTEIKNPILVAVISKYVPWLLRHVPSMLSIKMPEAAIYLPDDPNAGGFAWTWFLKQKVYTEGDCPIIAQAHFVAFGDGKVYDPEMDHVVSVGEYNKSIADGYQWASRFVYIAEEPILR